MTAQQASCDAKKQDHKGCTFRHEWLTEKNGDGMLTWL